MLKRISYLLLFLSVFFFVKSQAQTVEQLSTKKKEALDKGDYKSAIAYAKIIVEKEEKNSGKTSLNYAVAINDLGMLYSEVDSFSVAESLLLEAKTIYEKTVGNQHRDYASICNNLSTIYDGQGKYLESQKLLEESKSIVEKKLGKGSADYALACNNLASVYCRLGNDSKAEPLFMEAKAVQEKISGKENLNYALFCSNLADLYRNKGNYETALSLCLEGKAIRKKLLGKDHVDYATSCNNLGIIYQVMGNYVMAEASYKEAKSIYEKKYGKEHTDYAACCDNLAGLLAETGDYVAAEPLFLESMAIKKKVLGNQHPDYALSCMSLANFYKGLGNYTAAEPLYIEAKTIFEKTFGKEHPSYANSCNNLAMLYKTVGSYKKAELLYRESMEIREQVLGKEHLGYANSCSNLGMLYDKMGNYAAAEPLYKEAKSIREKLVGKEHPTYAISCMSLAVLYKNTGRYPEAEPLYMEAKAIREKAFGKEHPLYASTCYKIALFYYVTEDNVKALSYYKEAIAVKTAFVEHTFTTLSEKEKELFYESVNTIFSDFSDFALKSATALPSVTSDLYNLQLVTKALLFQSANGVRERILRSKNDSLIALYQNWQAQRNCLAKVYEMKISEKAKKNIDQEALEAKANDTEKKLVLQSADFNKVKNNKHYTWEEVQKKLQPGEAAIEIIRSFSYKERLHKNKIGDTVYIALIVTKNTASQPILCVLTNGGELEKKYLRYYQNAIKFKTKDEWSYAQYWKPIQEVLAKESVPVKKIYFSADGVYNQISLNVLLNKATGKYLYEETELQLVSNTKDLITKDKSQNRKPTKATLLGYPDYQNGKNVEEINDGEIRSVPPAEEMKGERFLAGNKVVNLPGTKAEVEMIAKILEQNNITPSLYLAEQADEVLLKSFSDLQVLHIATHGFFLKDPMNRNSEDRSDDTEKHPVTNPLFRSGLLLAGCQNTINKEPLPEGKEDGILTAYEAMSLNLDNTDLVILSACETGLGEVKNGEGVYGLQRAFQTAGANTVLMSLWTVSDAATQELMINFYKNWLQYGDKRKAFAEAQNQLRKKYPEPYYWGAFVMVGE
jgi:CHAT domain-containing protein